jgi:restriction endonuclease
MQRGLSRKLRQGRPVLNADLSVSVYAGDESLICLIHPAAFAGGGMGYFFERIVCLHYEKLGYEVEERSCLGYQDRGVDLVANAPGERVFVQCKFTLQSMGSKKVEELLYSASVFVSENLSAGANYFDLVVPSLALAFPAQRGTRKPSARHAFVRHNGLQNKVKLRLVEVPIELPDEFDLPPATGPSVVDATGAS